MFSHRRCLTVLVIGCIALTSFALNGTMAQSNRSKSKSKSARRGGVRAIDAKAEKVEQEFIKEAFGLAKEYSDAGQLERSKKLLEAIIKLDDTLDPVKERIKQINEEILTSNSVDLKVDIGQGWTRPIARVFKGRKFRIKAEGTYTVTAKLELDVNGLPKEGPSAMTGSMPMGALMGTLIKEDGKPGKPFLIKDGTEINPKDDAQLSIRVNVPGELKCVGRLDVHLSGYVVTAKSR